MKEVTIAVPGEEYGFLMQLLQRLHFVKVKEHPGKEELLNGLQGVVDEVNDIKAGKNKANRFNPF